MSISQSIRNCLELSRLSNIPTVVTNVLVGVALVTTEPLPGAFTIVLIALAMILFYIGGMALNDVIDAPIDATERPERPLPSGRITKRATIIFTVTCFVIGLGIMVTFNRYALYMALGLVTMIVAYDLVHKKWAGSVVLMGLCRSLVYIGGAAAITWPLDWAIVAPASIALMLYIILLTIIARVESKTQPGRRVRLAYLLPLPVLVLFLFLPPGPVAWPLLSAFLMVAWLVASSAFHLNRTPPRIGGAVQGWLAGLCLIDAHVLALLDQPILMGIALFGFVLTLIGHRFIMGT